MGTTRMSTAERVPDGVAVEGGRRREAPLIATKLGAPGLAASFRDRPRLDALLDRALAEATRLTLLSAPPGYGKSVAVAGWLARRPVPHAWLSLDAADNDPTRFLRYLVAALDTVRPGIGGSSGLSGGAGAGVDVDFAGAALVDAIAASDEPFVLVLDDYHAITSTAVHELVALLVTHGPPFAHVVVATREDPPFPLARLRAHGRLVELRADTLRYFDDEAQRYFADLAGLELEPGDVTRVVDRTEGWIAGVQLAAISLQGRADAHALVDAFAGTQRFVLDYLAAEVLGGLDADLREFLVRISVAGRFTVGLCRALSGRDDSAALLDRAEHLNLFLIPLDLERRWFRFHHLFADYLRTLIDDDLLAELHGRAADYCEREGLTGEAIEHALAAGSTERAVRLLEAVARATYEAGELSTLLGWLDGVPRDRVAASPELISMLACSAFQVGRVGEAAAACAEGEAARRGETTPGPLLTVKALVAAFAVRPDAIELGRAAVAANDQDHFFRARAHQALAAAYLNAGDLRAAAETARAALDLEAGSTRSTLVVAATTALVSALSGSGHRREAEALCRQTMANHRDEAIHMAGGTPYALYWLGMVLYESNDLDEALDALERAWTATGTFGFGRALIANAVYALALARQATGSPEAALEAVRMVRSDARAAGLGEIEPGLAQIEARLLVMQGDLAAAAAWADRRARDPEPIPDGRRWLGLSCDLTVARVRLAQGNTREARRALEDARRAATATGNVADLLSIGVVDAAIAEATGNRAAAQRALEDTIRVAAPEGYLRRVIDDGPSIAHLLPAVRRVAPEFVDAVAAELAGTAASQASRPGRAGPSLWRDADGQSFEALTARELEVLGLMAHGAGDAAIARSLVVSLATAKWHAAHIRAKLGARSRTQAILRAQELGLV
jgi:LuxR family maltose regulon positive regulatory protein